MPVISIPSVFHLVVAFCHLSTIPQGPNSARALEKCISTLCIVKALIAGCSREEVRPVQDSSIWLKTQRFQSIQATALKAVVLYNTKLNFPFHCRQLTAHDGRV